MPTTIVQKLRPCLLVAAAALGLTSATALAGSATVQVFRLGKVNKINAKSELRGGTSKPLFLVRNTKGPPLGLVAPAGVPPLSVTSSVKVANLNSDLLDGLDATALQRRISGTCASGEAIRVVNLDGTVSCQAVTGGAGGTVTSVDSGTGLVGGPITTAGTLSLASPYRLPQSCSTNQIPKSDGSNAWSCAADQNSGGTVTSVDSGTGLSGGPITGSGALSLASSYRLPQSCLANQIPQSDGSNAWSCAADQNSGGTVTSVDSGTGLSGGPITGSGALSLASAYRLPQSCANGQIPKSDGSNAWSCAANAGFARPTPAGNELTTLDSTGFVGRYTSVTIGADGLGLVSYYDNTNADLKVAHCANTTCSSATTATLDSTGSVGQYTWITIDADGLGLVSYYDDTNFDLKVAHCSNTACSSATTATLDSTGDVGQYTSITIGADGLGLISYHDVTSGTLKVAHCANAACSSSTNTMLDSTGTVGQYTSVTIGADGWGLISYYDQTNLDLKVAHCSNTACSSATTATLDSSGNVGLYTSVTIGTDGLGLVSYYDDTNFDLKVAHCTNTTCSSATLATLDSTGFVGEYTSVTIGADGLGLVSYYDDTNFDLKVAHCASSFCTPYFRRR